MPSLHRLHVCNYWTGPLDWTTRLTFDLKFSQARGGGGGGGGGGELEDNSTDEMYATGDGPSSFQVVGCGLIYCANSH